MRRLFVGCMVALALANTGAGAQSYPTRAITLIVPFAAGGPADVTGRIVAEALSRQLGQQVVIENVVGAGGTTGVTRGARAAPDGYTLTLGHMGTHAAAVVEYPNLAYKPETDFEPISLVAEFPLVLVTRKDFPPNTLREFVSYTKENEAKINMAHAGVGSVSHTGCLLLDAAIGIKPTLVPFTGTAPATTALLGGQVDYVCDPISGQLGNIRAGMVKGLAIAAPRRHPALPDVPTAAEGGLPAFAASPFYGVFAPKGTPAEVRDRLVQALNAGLDDGALRKRFIDLGADVPEKERRGPQPLAAIVKSEIARLTPILQAAGK
jgi:putative tricarboxylic transport membrane protein